MNIDLGLLQKTCLAGINKFSSFGDVTETSVGRYIHKDNQSKILAVAHLDTATQFNHFHVLNIRDVGKTIISPALDDRLGVYVILYLLPSLGVSYDILLTEGEEIGQSTAQFFAPPDGREYNWMFSFDRRGTDVVMYQYETPEMKKLLKDSGLMVGNGSFSDIAFLDHLEVTGFNFGVGYNNEHGHMCYAHLNDTRRMVSKFVKFYQANKNTHLPYTPKIQHRSGMMYTFDGRRSYPPPHYNYEPDRDKRWDGWTHDEWDDEDNLTDLTDEQIETLSKLCALEKCGLELEQIPTGTSWDKIGPELLAAIIDSEDDAESLLSYYSKIEADTFEDLIDGIKCVPLDVTSWMLENIWFPTGVVK